MEIFLGVVVALAVIAWGTRWYSRQPDRKWFSRLRRSPHLDTDSSLNSPPLVTREAAERLMRLRLGRGSEPSPSHGTVWESMDEPELDDTIEIEEPFFVRETDDASALAAATVEEVSESAAPRDSVDDGTVIPSVEEDGELTDTPTPDESEGDRAPAPEPLPATSVENTTAAPVVSFSPNFATVEELLALWEDEITGTVDRDQPPLPATKTEGSQRSADMEPSPMEVEVMEEPAPALGEGDSVERDENPLTPDAPAVILAEPEVPESGDNEAAVEPAPGPHHLLEQGGSLDDNEVEPDARDDTAPASDQAEVIGYCSYCRAKRPLVDATPTRTRKGKPAIRGSCMECGSGMFVFTADD